MREVLRPRLIGLWGLWVGAAVVGNASVQWTYFYGGLLGHFSGPETALLHSFVVPTISIALIQCLILLFAVRWSLVAFAWVPISWAAFIPFIGLVGLNVFIEAHLTLLRSLIVVFGLLVLPWILLLIIYGAVLGFAQGAVLARLFGSHDSTQRLWISMNLMVPLFFLVGVDAYSDAVSFLKLGNSVPGADTGAYPVVWAAITGLGLAVIASRESRARRQTQVVSMATALGATEV